MAANFFTVQRGIIAALATAPVQPSGLLEPRPNDPDAQLVEAWNNRQRALAEIESRGSFFNCEECAPAAAEAFDVAEATVLALPAKTVRGAALKLWSAASLMGNGFTPKARTQSDIIRRADLGEVEMIEDRFECDLSTIIQTIRSLMEIDAA